MRRLIIAVGCSVFFACASSALKEDKKHIVFLTGDDSNHRSGTHEFFAGAKLLGNSLLRSELKNKFTTEVIHNWDGDEIKLQKADVVVHYYKGNRWHFMNKKHAVFTGLSKKGVGQVFIHYATDPRNINAEEALSYITGGFYKEKKSKNPHWVLDSKLNEGHPINRGVLNYKLYDEWYHTIAFDTKLAHETKSSSLEKNKTYAVMWGKSFKNKRFQPSELTVMWAKENQFKGRGVGITGGHYHKNWAVDTFRKQVLNAIVWAAKVEVPNKGVFSPKITEKEINLNLRVRKDLKRIILK